jgi:hypothetical protein
MGAEARHDRDMNLNTAVSQMVRDAQVISNPLEFRGRQKPSEAPYGPLKLKQGHRALVKHYEPNGCNPNDHCDGNHEPGENSQPRTHAVAGGVLPVSGLDQSLVWLTSGPL